MMLKVRVDALTRGNIVVPRMPRANPDFMGNIRSKMSAGLRKTILIANPNPKMMMPGNN